MRQTGATDRPTAEIDFDLIAMGPDFAVDAPTAPRTAEKELGTMAIKANSKKVEKAISKAIHNGEGEGAAAKYLKPSSGQSGPKIKLELSDLNHKEQKVLKALQSIGERSDSGIPYTMTIGELASACFGKKSKAQSNSWTRNSLRRLVCSGLVRKMAPGVYRASKIPAKKAKAS